ncbi:RHS repeat-associated core domain-containing protein [Kurthia sibirica]|uniref:RHS repeat-associated core domain-containing protein n=1 Tax=Kurthia sibirica TaxID=202750 RepID=UPI002012ACCA|nr:RHS repeat-associated core domain-containing protein [Kurthia sibirica]
MQQYDAYGNILNVDGEIAEENPIRYAGYYYDKETKNYYLEARYYNPNNGSFLALDPHPGDDDEPLSQNGYSYANGNPIINVDPEGLKPNRIHYALMTGLAYVVDEIVSTFTDFTWLVLTVYDVIKGYTDVKKAHKQNLTVQSKKIIEKSKTLKKQIEQIVREKAIKAGITVFKRSFDGAYLLSKFGIGIVQGARDKYFKDANCFRNGARYGKYVVQERLH